MSKENKWTYERLNSIILLLAAFNYIFNFIMGTVTSMGPILFGLAIAYVGMYLFTYYKNKK